MSSEHPLQRLAQHLRDLPPRRLAIAATAILVLAASIWFFVARDARGKTARLTADAWYYHAYLPSLVLDRDLDFTNEYRITKNWYRFGETETGRPANVFGIGPALFTLPLFVVGHGVAHISDATANGFSGPETLLPLYASLLASLLALFPGFVLVRRRLDGCRSGWRAAAVPILLACAGPVVYYAVRQPGYAHPFATLWVAWLIERWDASFDDAAEPRSLRTWLVLGALLGASALARPQCALWAGVLLFAAVDDLLRLWRRQQSPGSRGQWLRSAVRTALPRWLAGAALSLVLVSPQLFAWQALFGAYIASPQGPGFMWWTTPAWSEVLFSSRNGLFPWAPLYALAAVGLALSLRRTPRLTAALLLGVALQVIANGAAWDWWAGGSYGGRRFDSCFVAFCYGLGYLVIPSARGGARAVGAHRLLAAAVAVVSVGLAIGNIALANHYSAPSARIYGGQAAAEIMRQKLGPALGGFTATASTIANAPARVLFALEHDAGLDAYDRVVGTHLLGELYPGLNSFRGKTHQRVTLNDHRAAFLIGVEGEGKEVMVAKDRAAILVGLNRRDDITAELRITAPATTTPVELRWNGRLVSETVTPANTPTTLRAAGLRPRRGTNTLEVRAPAKTRMHSVVLRSSKDPRGKQ